MDLKMQTSCSRCDMVGKEGWRWQDDDEEMKWGQVVDQSPGLGKNVGAYWKNRVFF